MRFRFSLRYNHIWLKKLPFHKKIKRTTGSHFQFFSALWPLVGCYGLCCPPWSGSSICIPLILVPYWVHIDCLGSFIHFYIHSRTGHWLEILECPYFFQSHTLLCYCWLWSRWSVMRSTVPGHGLRLGLFPCNRQNGPNLFQLGRFKIILVFLKAVLW